MTAQHTILSVLASPRGEASVSRQLADKVIAKLSGPDSQVLTRDVSAGVPIVDGAWIGAAFGGDDKSALATSETLVGEVLAANHIVIATPIWNFGVPSSLKAWID